MHSRPQIVRNINAYLLDGDDVFIYKRSTPIYQNAPIARNGNKPIDDGNYLFSEEERNEFIKKEPMAEKYFRPWYGSYEFINRKPRYCLWLRNCPPNELRKMPEVMKRMKAVREYRLKSRSEGTVKLADNPTRFHIETILKEPFLLLPVISSERRNYIPVGFMSPECLPSNSVNAIENATVFHFGILTSNVHMAWMRTVCGRLEMSYSYSIGVVYNNFPWCDPTPEQKAKIEETAQKILDARALYPDCSFADLYNDLTMPPELKKAHRENDRAVMDAYGFFRKDLHGHRIYLTEPEIVTELMRMYQEKVKEIEFAAPVGF